eukprot:GCRY01005755.1.p1 GENE.GCRY01005755.1~~GCRY01005755.1.p1  ORF type:complete len:305 (+),score=54.30 GCRY01005755.1:76-990(+)
MGKVLVFSALLASLATLGFWNLHLLKRLQFLLTSFENNQVQHSEINERLASFEQSNEGLLSHLEEKLTPAVKEELAKKLEDSVRVELAAHFSPTVQADLRLELYPVVREEVRRSLSSAIRSEVKSDIWNSVWLELRDELKDEVFFQLREELRQDVLQELRMNLREEVIMELKTELRESVHEEMRQNVGFVTDVPAISELPSPSGSSPASNFEVSETFRKEILANVLADVESQLLSFSSFSYDNSLSRMEHLLSPNVVEVFRAEVKQSLREEMHSELKAELMVSVRQEIEEQIWKENEERNQQTV